MARSRLVNRSDARAGWTSLTPKDQPEQLGAITETLELMTPRTQNASPDRKQKLGRRRYQTSAVRPRLLPVTAS